MHGCNCRCRSTKASSACTLYRRRLSKVDTYLCRYQTDTRHSFRSCRNRRHGRNLVHHVSDCRFEITKILTCCFEFFICDEQRSCISTPDTHLLTQRTKHRTVLLFLPHFCERFSVLQFEIVIFRDPKSHMISRHCLEGIQGFLTLGTPPKVQRIPAPLPLLPP